MPSKNHAPTIEPLLATLVDAVPTGPGRIYEIKYDGYLTLVTAGDADVRCCPRCGLDWTGRCGSVPRAIVRLKLRGALIHREMVVMDDDGRASFAGLQDALKRHGAGLRYAAFDLLALDGKDLRGLPLVERKQLLAKPDPSLIYSAHVQDRGAELLNPFAAVTMKASWPSAVASPTVRAAAWTGPR